MAARLIEECGTHEMGWAECDLPIVVGQPLYDEFAESLGIAVINGHDHLKKPWSAIDRAHRVDGGAGEPGVELLILGQPRLRHRDRLPRSGVPSPERHDGRQGMFQLRLGVIAFNACSYLGQVGALVLGEELAGDHEVGGCRLPYEAVDTRPAFVSRPHRHVPSIMQKPT